MGGLGFKGNLFLLMGLVCAVLFMPTTLIAAVCMMPTLAANVMDRSRGKNRTICVGMMNLAGTIPFLLGLWMSPTPNSLDAALSIIFQPKVIIIAYMIAGAGYAIETAVTGMVATVTQQRARARIKTIDTILDKLTDRWDDFVDGSVPLDDYGFPKYNEDDDY